MIKKINFRASQALMVLMLVRAALTARLTARLKTVPQKARRRPETKPERVAVAWGIESALQSELRDMLVQKRKFGGITRVDFYPTADITALVSSGARLLIMITKPDEAEAPKLLVRDIKKRTQAFTGRQTEVRSFCKPIQLSKVSLLMNFVWIG